MPEFQVGDRVYISEICREFLTDGSVLDRPYEIFQVDINEDSEYDDTEYPYHIRVFERNLNEYEDQVFTANELTLTTDPLPEEPTSKRPVYGYARWAKENL